jgi:putative addiction module component (TIGR02574 family)
MKLEEVKLEALRLPSEEREELVHTLIRSLDEEDDSDPEVEAAIMKEVKRRYQAIKEGTAELIPAEEVFAELHAELD